MRISAHKLLQCTPRRLRHKKVHSYALGFYVFGHFDLISGLTEMLRTILELADYFLRRSVAIDGSVIRFENATFTEYAKKSLFFIITTIPLT